LLEGLKRELPQKAAIVMTALLFAFMHGSLTGLPAHVALGFVITLLALRQNNLQLPMLFHFSYNAASLIISLYFSRALEGVDVQAAQAVQDVQSPSMILAVFSLLSMALLATYAFWFLIRPLVTFSAQKSIAPSAVIATITRRKKVGIIALTVVLLLLLLPIYVLNLMPA
jgi:membrane protease YdiL (CAAX protease family)